MSQFQLPARRDLYYGGGWHQAAGGTAATISPSTGQSLGTFAVADARLGPGGRNGTAPMRTRRQRSSAQGGAPATATLGRNRVIGTGRSPSAASQPPSSPSEPALVSSRG